MVRMTSTEPGDKFSNVCLAIVTLVLRVKVSILRTYDSEHFAYKDDQIYKLLLYSKLQIENNLKL